MGLRKKKSRLITICGVTYRWVVSPDDYFMVLVAELAERAGQRLEVFFEYHDVYEPQKSVAHRPSVQCRIIHPEIVRKVIEAALNKGWQPSERKLPILKMNGEKIVPLGDSEAEPS